MEPQVRSLVEMIEALPPELQQEVREFVELIYEYGYLELEKW